MRRTRVDGIKFQNLVKEAVEKSTAPAYLVRLYLPQAAVSAQNISDYIVFASHAFILEVKETKHSSFSLNTFQQKEEAEKFKQVYDALCKETKPDYFFAILIHFIAEEKYSIYFLDKGDFTVVHPDDEDVTTFLTLQEAIDYLLTL